MAKAAPVDCTSTWHAPDRLVTDMLRPIAATSPLLPLSASFKPLLNAPLLPPSQAVLVSEYLKAALPLQQEPTRLLALLWQLAQSATTLPDALQPLLTLIDNLPDPAQLSSADGLHAGLLGSGLFLESQLLNQAPTLSADYKGNLLKLWQVLAESLGQRSADSGNNSGRIGQVQALSRHVIDGLLAESDSSELLGLLAQDVQGSLARVQMHQLMHLQDQSTQQRLWLLELPVRSADGIDVLQLHIERDGRHGAEAIAPAPSWQVTLSFDFPSTGAVMVRLRWSVQAVAITFHAERAGAYEQISSECRSFSELLASKGLADVQVSALRGLPHGDTLPQPLRSQLQVRA